jgi:hypothetical protein
MTLPYGTHLCDGVPSAVNPKRPCIVCMDCQRRLASPDHAWQKYLTPPPAKHDGSVWVCSKRVGP